MYLDEGWIKYCKVPKLYKISTEIDLPKPLAVEVFACDMAPSDSSFDWNPHTSKFVSDLLKGKEIHGKVTPSLSLLFVVVCVCIHLIIYIIIY